MAAPASLIGALINLYSLKDIRYEGTLYNYNPTEKTVALQNGALTNALRSLARAHACARTTNARTTNACC